MHQEVDPKVDGAPLPPIVAAAKAAAAKAAAAKAAAAAEGRPGDYVTHPATDIPPPDVQRTHDDVQLYIREGVGGAAAIELLKVQHAREIREALEDIAESLGDIRGVLGEIADK